MIFLKIRIFYLISFISPIKNIFKNIDKFLKKL